MDGTLPEVVLIGDSIRGGYEEVVREELRGVARVWTPGANGGNSANVLAHLEDWAVARGAAVVHLNCGLHDLKREFGAPQNAVPPAVYRQNLRRIFERLQRAAPRRRLIWATTTPVNQERHHAVKGFDRFEADVEAYNAIGLQLAGEFGLAVNDLYGRVMAAGRDGLLLPDGVHFTADGYAVLGRAVAEAVRLCLNG